MADCKWMFNEICVNADCPMVADYCPVPDNPGVCRYEERGKMMANAKNATTTMEPCPFCGNVRAVKCLTADQIDSRYEDCPSFYAVVCDYSEGGCGATGGYRDTPEEAVDTWNRRTNAEPPRVKVRPEPNLDGKCGSCEHSVMAIGHFGNSRCYVECKNAEHLSERRYYGRPLVAIRQRTAKACKHYKKRVDNGLL